MMFRYILIAAFAALVSTSAFAQTPKLGADTSVKVTPEDFARAKAEVTRGTYLRALWRSVRIAREGSPVTEAAKEQANQLIDEADRLATAGDSGSAYPLLLQGLSLLTEVPWTPSKEFAVSLALSTQTLVADDTAPLLVTLTQRFKAKPPSDGVLQLRTSLVEAPWPSLESLAGIGNLIDVKTPIAKIFWTNTVKAKDLIFNPVTDEVDIAGLPEGNYLVKAELLQGTENIATVTTPVTIIHDLVHRSARMEQKLAALQGHDSAKASARYAFNLVRSINGWRRELPENVDLPKAVKASEEIADQLAQGKDTLYRAKGDHKRHYWLAEAGEILPYRIYVPASWDGKMQMPMVINLHGGGGNEDQDFEDVPSGTASFSELAERFHVIVISVSGYRPNGGYGQVYGPAPPVDRPGVWPLSPAKTVLELSELDTLRVMDLVAQEYNVDRARVYLVGNSLGGGGVWHLGSKYPEKFAAVAPCASSMDIRRIPDFPFDRMSVVPTIAVVGERDEDVRKAIAHYGIDELQKRGDTATLVEVKNGIHTNSWRIELGGIFEFFLKYHK